MAAETELQALVVRLQADLSSFKAEMLKGQKVVAESAMKMDKSIGEFTASSESRMSGFSDAIGTAFSVFAAGGAIAAGLEATKFAMDQIFESENIRAASVQFELLARNAGIAGAALRDGLVGAANGLIDDTDLIKQANQSIIAMGATARDLPAVMELARKATAAFGGTASDNFTAMATAIANGNTRQLKNLGIVIDQEQAYKRFAEKLGVSAESLSQAGRQQAMMNAVLEKGKTAYAGVTDEVIKSQTSWQQLKVSLGQIGETATLAFGKMAGPTTTGMFASINKWLKETNVALIDHFGSGAEQAAAHTEHLKIKISGLKDDLAELEAVQARVGKGDPYNAAIRAKEIERLHQQIYAYSVQLRQSQTAEEKLAASNKETQKTVKDTKESYVNLKTLQQEYAEEGKKLAESLVELSPEKVQKQALDDLKLAREEDKISLADYYSIQKQMLEQRMTDEQALVKAAREKNQIDELTYQSSMMALQAKYNSDLAAMNAAKVKDEQKQTEQRLGYASKFFGDMSSLMRTKSSELFEIGKAAATAQAIVDGYAAVQKTLASVPYPFSIPLAAAAGVAAAVNVANIQAQHMATGGVVPGITPVGDQVPIMANSGEMFLNKQQQTRLFDMIDGAPGAGGGGAVQSLLSQLIQEVRSVGAAIASGQIIQIDGQAVFEAVRGQVRAGRALA